MRSKLESYLGFAAKSGNLVSGTGSCTFEMAKGKIKLLIVAVDLGENSAEKLISQAKASNVPYRVYGESDNLSAMVGKPGRGVFGIKDNNFAKIISEQIDLEEKEELK